MHQGGFNLKIFLFLSLVLLLNSGVVFDPAVPLENANIKIHGSVLAYARSVKIGPFSGKVSDIGFEPDAIVECTGVGPVIEACIQQLGPNGILCLTGVGHGGHMTRAGTADMAAAAVLRNTVIVGSVNANKRQWYRAGQTLAKADKEWLSKLITHRVKPEDFSSALERKPEDIKVVIQFSEI